MKVRMNLKKLRTLKTFKSLMVLLAICLMAGCSEDDNRTDGNAPLTLFAQMETPATRATTDNKWDGGEQVAVRVNSEAATTFTVQMDGVLESSSIYWNDFTSISARAWYPAGTWVMQSNQSDIANFKEADFLFAPEVSGITAGNYTAQPLRFYHKTAKVTATITNGAGITPTDISAATVSFFGYTNYTGIDLTTSGAITGASNGWITSYNIVNTYSYTALLIPQDMIAMAGTEFIRITLDGISYYYKLPAGGINLQAGYAYTYTITVHKTGLEVTVESPTTDWGAGPAFDVPATAAVAVFTLEGLTSGKVAVNYKDKPGLKQEIDIAANGKAIVPLTTTGDEIIRSIQINGGAEILIGRKEGDLKLKFVTGALAFRDPESGFVPIGSYAEFQKISTALGGKYKQEADLDLMSIEWTPINGGSTGFTGEFDGGGHTVANLKIISSGTNIGLFGKLTGGTLRNIHISSGVVSGNGSVGGLAGTLAEWSSVINCSNNAEITSSSAVVGGIAGNCDNRLTITGCKNTGNIVASGTANNANEAGGILGNSKHYSNKITACYNTGNVSGYAYIGGICGASRGDVTACYSTGKVTGYGYVGGVIGIHQEETIRASYWEYVSGGATVGVGENTGRAVSYTTQFGVAGSGLPAWPIYTSNPSDAWSGTYWKPYVAGEYPKLIWE
jgi:hypothetical protein